MILRTEFTLSKLKNQAKFLRIAKQYDFTIKPTSSGKDTHSINCRSIDLYSMVDLSNEN